MKILGISAFYHDSAACLLDDGKIVAAAQEERFTRKKQDSSFPEHAVSYCLEEAGIDVSSLDYVVFYDKPLIKFERLLESYLAVAPLGYRSFIKAIPVWLREKMFARKNIRKMLEGYDGPILFTEHHESHAASAFFPSPFEEAAIITCDGVGEWATTSYGVGRGNKIDILSEIHFPHSLGLLYSAFTYYLGFKVNSGEYKVMGLAPYGEPKYVDLIMENLIDVKDDGSFRLNMKYFDYVGGLKMTSRHFNKLFGGPPRKPETDLTQKEMDLARSIQEVTEEVMLRIARHVHQVSGMKNLCLAGGVALNCVANGRILREGPYDDIWIQPAAGDAGGALGAAFAAWHHYLKEERTVLGEGKSIQGSSKLGPEFSDEEVKAWLESKSLPYEELAKEDLPKKAAKLLANENIIGWHDGRMEFGPRALGGRSILGDARSPKMQRQLNLKIKFRESFRPFAPSALAETVSDWFEFDRESPYMLLVAPVKKEICHELTQEQQKLFGIEKLNIPRSTIPAVTHVDYSARLQTVNSEDHPRYHALISEFYKETGCPVIVNTSFNVRGEPIVCTPDDAYTCFMRTDMDYLVLGNILLDKKKQPEWKEAIDWRKQFELD